MMYDKIISISNETIRFLVLSFNLNEEQVKILSRPSRASLGKIPSVC